MGVSESTTGLDLDGAIVGMMISIVELLRRCVEARPETHLDRETDMLAGTQFFFIFEMIDQW